VGVIIIDTPPRAILRIIFVNDSSPSYPNSYRLARIRQSPPVRETRLNCLADVFASAERICSENMFVVRYQRALRSADDFDPLFFHFPVPPLCYERSSASKAAFTLASSAMLETRERNSFSPVCTARISGSTPQLLNVCPFGPDNVAVVI